MKRIILGAAGLLLSGTALAAIGTSKDMDDGAAVVPVAAKEADSLGGSPIANAITIDWPTKATDDDKSNDPTKVIEASVDAKAEPATAEAPSTAEMSESKAAGGMTGMGGPDEPEAVATRAAATPVTTQTSWPACAPGPGDDNCIQLYEPGVRQAYAAWQGANLPGAEQTAMGGPEEPLEDAAAAPAATDYPVCRSRDDDRCIQPGEHETLASVDDGSERLAMGGPEEPVEGAELAAAYEPLPEDAVMPATDEEADKNSPDTMAI